MIEQADDALAAWAGEVLPGASVSLAPDAAADVVLDLVELRERDRRAGEVALRYRVTTGGDDVRERHRRLGELLFAALARPGYDVDLTPDPAAGAPSFVIAVAVGGSTPVPASPVRGPLVLRDTGVRRLAGTILGPGDVPVADAYVELPLLGLTTRSDRRGHFTFPAVPTEPAAQLVVHAKARTFPFSVDGSDVELRLDLVAKG